MQIIAGSFVPEVPPLEVRLVRLGIHDPVVSQSRLFMCIEVDPDLLRDRPGDFVLQRQGVAPIAIVGLRPQVLVVPPFDQLGCNPHLIAGAQNRPFHQGVHVQLARDLRQRLARTFVRHHRGPRNHT